MQDRTECRDPTPPYSHLMDTTTLYPPYFIVQCVYPLFYTPFLATDTVTAMDYDCLLYHTKMLQLHFTERPQEGSIQTPLPLHTVSMIKSQPNTISLYLMQ